MDPQEFTKLYSRQELDESLTTFRDGIGFSLIRFYPKDSPYYKDGKRIFIKVVLRDGKLDYGVDMTDPRKEEDQYEYFIT
ncbi:MAG TPA: hypothetical protein VFK94_03140, partial [Patescibacteria group bacterium]|nr:hypothetical protein [Patescibacteria group bacterium]